MAGFSPRFCTIHMKIHVCSDTGVTNKLKAQEDAINYKIRRLHGQQTEEDKALEQEKIKKGMKEGSIGALLAKAKAVNAKQREETGINDEDLEHGPLVSEENISDRMARLRNKALGNSAPESAKPPAAPESKDSPVTMAIRKNSKPAPLGIDEEAELSKSKVAAKKVEIEEDEDMFDAEYFEDQEDEEEDIHAPVYSTAEVSKMITDAVDLALTRYINATSKSTAKKPATKAPAKKTVTKAPAKKPATKAPVKKTVTKAPAKKPATKAPVKKTVTKAPAKKPATKAPVKKTVTTKKK